MFDIHSASAAAFTVGIDRDGFRFDDINTGISIISGISPDDYIGKRPHELFPAELADRLVDRYRLCAQSRQPVSYEIEFVLPSGYVCWRSTIVPMLSRESGAVTSFVGLCVDITAEKMTERASVAFHEKMSAAIGAIDGGFWVYDIETEAFETSRPLAELIAGPGYETLSFAEYVGYVYAEDLQSKTSLVNAKDGACVEYRVIAHDGRTRWLQSKRRRVFDENGKVVRIVGLVLDVTEQKATMQALESQATTDSLTQIKNRRAFDRIAARSFRDLRGSATRLGLVLVDLDGFKPINDKYGHRAGDDLLRKVARRLAGIVRDTDALARIGGDEFAILAREVSTEDMSTLLPRIERAFARPFRLGTKTVFVGASIGAVIQAGSDRSIDDLFQRADRALYSCKNERRLKRA